MKKKIEQSKYLEDLNEEQKEAVTHREGPLLIVAGAGTGKTTVITRRLAYLIEKGLAKSQEILAVTFTEKAAQEMEERVDRLLPFGYLDLWVSTFHSFCERILKEHGLDIGLAPNFKILDQTAGWLLVRQNLDKFKLDYYKPLGNPTKFIHSLISHFARLKDEGIYPKDYLNYADQIRVSFDGQTMTSSFVEKTEKIDLEEAQIEAKRVEEVANAYHTYQRLLLENNFLDFGDLINYSIKLFKERPQILKKYREQFKYILVDEFQDTNWVQYELIKLLAAPRNNITVSFDDDQSIYCWRGASFNNVLQFKKDYLGAKEVILIKNYRSAQNILDLAYRFIQFNNPNRLEYQLNQEREIIEEAKKKGINLNSFKRINKKLVSQKEIEGIIDFLHFENKEAEARGVINKIQEILQEDKEATLSDFAILVRSNEAANIFCKELEERKIPYHFLASRGLYSQPVILDVISYFKMLDNYHENAALFRVLNSPILNIPYQDIVKITQFARLRAVSLYEALAQLPLIKGIEEVSVNKINHLLGLIKEHTQLALKANVSQVFLAFLRDSGYLSYLIKNQKEREINLLGQFYKKIRRFEESQIETTLPRFMEQLNMEIDSGELGALEFEQEAGPDMVKVMTIHSAKGLEFKYVFLVNLVDKKFPTTNRKEPIEIPKPLIKEIIPKGDPHLQEERRLFYVGMTRAKKGLYFCWADNYGGARKKKPSRFLYELNLEKQPLTKVKEIKPEKIKASSKKEDKVILPSYFSFTQFYAFKNCPLQYKFAHLLKIPRPGSPSLSFGKTIHNTLYQFLNSITEQKFQDNLFSLPQKESKEKKEIEKLLFKIYKNCWIDEWYQTKEQKEDYWALGKDVLRKFLKDFLESNPKIKFIDKKPALEVEFYLKIGDNTIKGKIDRIDELKEGIEIIDYKTGKTKTKLKEDEKDQLLIYQLAAERVLGLKPLKLTFYYLEEGKKISFIADPKTKESFPKKIEETIENIKKSEFLPTPGWHCKYCDFKDICEYRKVD
jgi:DNA helicase-2/ATP-dependent DNA helicase PcrA